MTRRCASPIGGVPIVSDSPRTGTEGWNRAYRECEVMPSQSSYPMPVNGVEDAPRLGDLDNMDGLGTGATLALAWFAPRFIVE